MTSNTVGIFESFGRFFDFPLTMLPAHLPNFWSKLSYESDIYPASRCGRHVHLTGPATEEVFGRRELTKERDLIQPHQFSTRQAVALRGPRREFDNVRLIGPARDYGKYNGQVEVSVADAVFLGIEPVVRMSGDLDGAPLINVLGPMGMVEVPAIVPQRHFHFGKDSHLCSRGFRDGDVVVVVPVRMNNGMEERGTPFGNVVLRYADDGRDELHLSHQEADVYFFDPRESTGLCEIVGFDPCHPQFEGGR